MVDPSPFHKRLPLLLLKALEAHKYGCLLGRLPADLSREISEWAKEHIPDEWLGTGGREDKHHVTIKFGFIEVREYLTEALQRDLLRHGPLSLRLGNFSYFENDGEEGWPLFLEVESPQLEELNRYCSDEFLTEDTHPKYVPHVTVAYVKPEFIDSLVVLERLPFQNREVVLEELEYSDPDKNKTRIPLTGAKALSYLDETADRVKGSYFADCERDDEGHCLPSGEAGAGPSPDRPSIDKPTEQQGRGGTTPAQEAPPTQERVVEQGEETTTIQSNQLKDVSEKDIPPKIFKTAKEKWNKLSPSQKKAVEAYTGGGLDGVNDVLREEGISGLRGKDLENYQLLRYGIRNLTQPFAEPVDLYRGVDLEGSEAEEFLSKMQEGETVEFAGFSSMSYSPRIANSFGHGQILLKIKSRSGAVLPSRGSSGELEVIHDAQKRYRVVGVKEGISVEGGKQRSAARVVELEEV